MQINIFYYIEGAKKARGLAVIIDVFRAFSVDAYVLRNGAEKIIPVGQLETAYQLKEENPDFILMGERKEKIMPGFDYGNSPTHIEEVDFTGKTVVQTTSAGTQGIDNARGADEIITGSFVNAGAIIKYIKEKQPSQVSLVAMGYNGNQETDEDRFCAEYIKAAITGEQADFPSMIKTLKTGSGARFFKPDNQERSPSRDFDLCLHLDAVDFVIRATPYKDDLVYLSKHFLSS